MKALLITGGSRGIGRAVALMAGRRGWAVAVNYLADKNAADAVVRTIETDGGRAVAVQGDVSDESELVSVFDGATRSLGALNGLVVNAGILAPSSSVADMSAERIRRMFEVNTIGAFLTAREGARRMSKDRGGKGGSIVFVSSIAVRLANPNAFLDYTGSKAAVDVLGIGLSKELAPAGVRVNVVRPGLIDTEMHASIGEPDRAARLDANRPRRDG
jgi:NAD(P)-dependent dehydrogenase (short-subunit alcohol dehydrogenase family)